MSTSLSQDVTALQSELSAARWELAAAAAADDPLESLARLTEAVERMAATQHELVNVLLDRGISWDNIGAALHTSRGSAERRFPRRGRRTR
jgi:hypothetical protein